MISGHRTLRESLSSKDGKTYIIIRTANDEFSGYLFGGFDAVRAQILCQHTRGDIHRQHDIDTFYRLTCPRVVRLRTSQHQYHHCEHQDPQQHGQRHKCHLPTARRIAEDEGVAHPHRGLSLLPVQHIPDQIRYDEQEQ